MFIGRERELAALNKLYASDKFEFVVIYGRRRVGKTALISQFIDDKNAIYFMGVESNAKQNLENFSKSILSYHTGMEAETSFLSFQAALEYVFKLAEKERIILAIDEYPYVARSSKSLASTIQLLIDQYKDTSKLMLILCGSSMSYMEDHVLAYKAPLYGRRTAQMKILPFDFEETCRYFQNFTAEEKAYVYGIVGGTPQYLLQMSDKLSIEDNIKNTFLNPNSALFEEPENLLKQEVREPALYNAIITAIATGASRMSEISGKVGENTNICSAYVKNLISLGIIEKETPYGEKASRKAIYSIADNMFRFWYRFVPQNITAIVSGRIERTYEKSVKSQLSDYMGLVFEKMCQAYLLRYAENLPFELSRIGQWWGSDPATRKQVQIDIVGADSEEKAFIIGSCKFKNEKIGIDEYERLKHDAAVFGKRGTYHYYIFSKGGFTDGLIEKAKEDDVRLVTLDEMYENR